MADWIMMTRHRALQLPDFAGPDGDYIPQGTKLRRPFPDARIYVIDHRDGWFFVYWITASLTSPLTPEGMVNRHGTPD